MQDITSLNHRKLIESGKIQRTPVIDPNVWYTIYRHPNQEVAYYNAMGDKMQTEFESKRFDQMFEDDFFSPGLYMVVCDDTETGDMKLVWKQTKVNTEAPAGGLNSYPSEEITTMQPNQPHGYQNSYQYKPDVNYNKENKRSLDLVEKSFETSLNTLQHQILEKETYLQQKQNEYDSKCDALLERIDELKEKLRDAVIEKQGLLNKIEFKNFEIERLKEKYEKEKEYNEKLLELESALEKSENSWIKDIMPQLAGNLPAIAGQFGKRGGAMPPQATQMQSQPQAQQQYRQTELQNNIEGSDYEIE